MTRQQKHILLFLVLAILIYSIWQIFFNLEKQKSNKPFTKGYSVENLELKITDESGKLVGKFTSPGLIRYTDSELILISKPKMWTYDDAKQHWQIFSEKAEYNNKTNEINFTEELKASSILGDKKSSFTANSLLVKLDNSTAYTNNGIVFNQTPFTMSGEIAKLDMKKEILEVNDNVKAIYKSSKTQ